MKINKIFLISIFFVACNAQNEEKATFTATHNTVEITAAQAKNLNISTANLLDTPFSIPFSVTGKVDVPPQNLATIYAQASGFVQLQDKILQGTYVSKGQVLMYIQNNQFLEMQQELQTLNNEENYLKADLDRQIVLAQNNAGALKTKQKAEMDFNINRVKFNALKERLTILGFDANAIIKGSLSGKVAIKSPINGYVTQVEVNLGKFVENNAPLMEIVDATHVHAELSVFETDLAKLYIGQRVEVQSTTSSETRLATVYLINKRIENDRTIRVHCHFNDENNLPSPGTFLKAKIFPKSERCYVLPEQAVVKINNAYVVFVQKDALNYEIVPVTLLQNANNMVVIQMNNALIGKQIVTEGAFKLAGILNNAPEE